MKSIAIIGGGPSGLFMFKKLIDAGEKDFTIHILDKGSKLGAGMPYSLDGACDEHVTNVSANEIPQLEQTIMEWIETVHPDTLHRFKINLDKFHEYRVLPRLLFGEYLADQFKLLVKRAKQIGIHFDISYNSEVIDIKDLPKQERISITLANGGELQYHHVIICTGHLWPKKYEQEIPNYFESPYPPSKLKFIANHPVALRGASLTAVDAIRTLARQHGTFHTSEDGALAYQLNESNPQFKIIMHSREGLLPAVRFHLDESILGKDCLFSDDEIVEIRRKNDGFVPLDLVFEEKFKKPLMLLDIDSYRNVSDLNMEEFVDEIMSLREKLDPFLLFKSEYREAAKSIKRKQAIHWKEVLCSLSYTLNYPAKYFSAEDTIRLKKKLMPLISLIIAFVPQSSAEELIALYDANLLELVAVGADSSVIPNAEGGADYLYTDECGNAKKTHYQTFVDCVGQPHLAFEDIPYPGLKLEGTIAPAMIQFRNKGIAQEMMEQAQDILIDRQGNYQLKVAGMAINDYFQVVDAYLAINPRIYVMAVPLIGGYNPDYSGLDFCETAANRITDSLLAQI